MYVVSVTQDIFVGTSDPGYIFRFLWPGLWPLVPVTQVMSAGTCDLGYVCWCLWPGLWPLVPVTRVISAGPCDPGYVRWYLWPGLRPLVPIQIEFTSLTRHRWGPHRVSQNINISIRIYGGGGRISVYILYIKTHEERIMYCIYCSKYSYAGSI